MAAPLKDGFGRDVPVRIAASLAAAGAAFPVDPFVADCLDGYDALELTPRARRIADAMARYLPGEFPVAADHVERSLDHLAPAEDAGAMAAFVHLPHVLWVAAAGLDHPERALALQHVLTRRFTAEFSVRSYIERHPEQTLRTLERWTRDPDHHVRRLVSEGTRPRLPWAPRLRGFVDDPSPVLPLLEALRDDPSGYVRRSVANNLNDIGKDHPDLLLDVAARWMRDAGPDRARLVRHALRSLTRAGDPRALAIIGLAAAELLTVEDLAVDPGTPAIGGRVRVTCRVVNGGASDVPVLAHLRVGFVKARGDVRPKTFVLGEATVPAGGARPFGCTVSLAQQSTRTHHPGLHPVTVVLNGVAAAETGFTLLA